MNTQTTIPAISTINNTTDTSIDAISLSSAIQAIYSAEVMSDISTVYLDSSIINYGETKNMKNKNNSIFIGTKKLMPNVKKIFLITKKIDKNEKEAIGIKVLFSDGSIEKAICDKEDVFNYDYGVAICIMKKLLSCISNSKQFTGTYYFNKIMNFAFKNNKKTFIKEQEQIKKEQREARRKEKNRLRKEKQKKAKKEAAIEIQKEAYLRAMKEYNKESE